MTKAFSGKEHAPVIPAYAGIQRGCMAMTDRLAMDAHFHGHDGALLLAEYSFTEIT